MKLNWRVGCQSGCVGSELELEVRKCEKFRKLTLFEKGERRDLANVLDDVLSRN